jgi:hypothetical protein
MAKKMTKKQKRNLMIVGGVAIGYAFVRSNSSALGFLTLPYEYGPSAPSYSYTPTAPSYSPSNDYSYYSPQPVAPVPTSTFSDKVYFNIVRQISETDGMNVIGNYDAFTKTPYVNPRATTRDLQVVKSQVANTLESDRLSVDQRNHLQVINKALGDRLMASSVDGYSAMGGVF